jgi:hypothetical protein
VQIAVVELTPGIADTDNWFAFKGSGSEALRAEGCPVIETYFVVPVEPSGTTPNTSHKPSKNVSFGRFI